jgi:hypothetical protein
MRPMLKDALAALNPRRRMRCSFCAREANEVDRLVAGPSVYICDGCVKTCVTVLRDNGGFELQGPERHH